jgi:hypothetical protein
METPIIAASLEDPPSGQAQSRQIEALEQGKVLYFPNVPFLPTQDMLRRLDPAQAHGKRKNISLDPADGTLRGVAPNLPDAPLIKALLQHYAQQAAQWADLLFPPYRGQLRAEPASLRLHRAETRITSWRKDDSRLHVDAFPSRPNRGQRILRIFMNINPGEEPRVWRIGEPFERVARHFLPRLPRQWPGSSFFLHGLGITKSRRSAYDHLMLALHDAMKADLDYQQHCPQHQFGFPPGSAWICFSDQTSHAVMAGQFMLEQTFFLPPEAMVTPRHSPLETLQRLTGKPLI